MRLHELLDLANSLEKYAAHLRYRGDQPAAEAAERMHAAVRAEALRLERAAQQFQEVAENA